MQLHNPIDPRERMTDDQENVRADEQQQPASLSTDSEQDDRDESLDEEAEYDDEE